MAKGKETKLFAYESFMEHARKEGRVRNEELSMKVLKPDLSLQARVNHIDKDHVRALHEILKNGQPLAPIIVFEIETGKFKIADGFHRHEVYKREGSLGIPCLVVKGTLQEAIEYAASANQKLSLARTREDTKKAAFMLLENGWVTASDARLSKQIGISAITAKKYRSEYCEKSGIEFPDFVVDETGRQRRLKPIGLPTLDFVKQRKRGTEVVRTHYQTRIGRKLIYLGVDKATAEARFAKLIEKRESRMAAFSDVKTFKIKLANHGIHLDPIHSAQDTVFVLVSGFKTASCSVVATKSWDAESILNACARAIFIAKHFDLPRKIVVAPELSESFQGLVEIAIGLGIEFMDFSHFIDAMKTEANGTGSLG